MLKSKAGETCHRLRRPLTPPIHYMSEALAIELSTPQPVKRGNRTHGASNPSHPDHAVWKIWKKINGRCNSKSNPRYSSYGGRGISVCKRWSEGDGRLTGFECFAKDMGRRLTPKHSVERVNNNGNYEPGNCKWATASEQQRNTRQNRIITALGETKTLVEWAESSGLSEDVIYARLARQWTAEAAISLPLTHGKRPSFLPPRTSRRP